MSAQLPSRVQPAQLSFLAIYNPALGPTDETFADQCVYWYSRKAAEARVAARQNARIEAAGGDAAREDENEKLRQIGLAQGMVDFAKSFSSGEPVDSIETERSRVVLHELEQGWWILASVGLTRLPSITPASSSEPPKKGTERVQSKPAFEYSSREVSPPALLVQQLVQAHHIFLLHHGPSLDELFVRLRRDKFCSILDRFWSRFTKHWDVRLHGNPAADVFGGVKLASGGELGFGVGEEEWGSGEREVLEDLAHRTEGLIDVVVSRFGEPAQAVASDEVSLPESEALPWMGRGSQPAASDGVLFSGIGAIARPSLRNVSLWMRQVYTYGEYAYGVRDNPVRERRKRRRRNPAADDNEPAIDNAYASTAPLKLDPRKLRQRVQKNAASNQATQELSGGATTDSNNTSTSLKDSGPTLSNSVTSLYHDVESPAPAPPASIADKPGIPPQVVATADRALVNSTKKAGVDPIREGAPDADDAGTTWGVPDTYMKYLTLGLSELAKPSKPQRPSVTKRTTTPKSTTSKNPKNIPEGSKAKTSVAPNINEDAPVMTHLDPMPDGEHLKARIAAQRRQENRGHFVIGLKGDLDEIPEDIDADMTDGSSHDDTDGPRTVLRTLQVELAAPPEQATNDEETLNEALRRTASSAGSSSNPALKSMQRMRVLIYVHRPFMYCFLFENRTSSLAYSGFYKDLHRNLLPVHKPLLSSTNVAKVAQRIEASHAETVEDTASVRSVGSTNTLPSKGGAGVSGMRPIFDLIYDPRLLTVHTSIPNIPEPGTPAAEGLSVGASKESSAIPAGWTRLDALNVHSRVLSTLHSVKGKKSEMERTSKTSRGWWVVWMRVPPSSGSAGTGAVSNAGRPETTIAASTTATLHNDKPDDHENAGTLTGPSTWTRPSTYIPSLAQPREPADMHRMAFLVRKSSDAVAGPTAAKVSTSSRVASGMWSTLTLRPAWDPTMAEEEEKKTSGTGSSWGPAALTGGMGVDARKYVEGLLSLNR
ncbi:hypothetical protein B0A55_03656 [Friedmanniomyces simplex]|uniref:CCZ1/INTU/HSP4 first Longin domain-containing protein n=1 Tax=Friedmanniomyces simplex TaxID=329884 RepID=A0A4U0XQT7_9PEZI|nr:hypothetical protein B0A55_03656 [Friedmanniomyces simplex]